jgi:hypothetical protein
VLEVLTPRTLTEIRSYFAVTADTDVVWVVYEALESRGTYTKIFEASGTATAGSATFHASGELSVPLEVGHFYALGVLVRGPHREYQSATAAEPVSFAAVVGGSRTTGSDVLGEIWVDVGGGGMAFQGLVTE